MLYLADKPVPCGLNDIEFTYEDVVKAVTNIKCKDSTGPDGLSSAFVKGIGAGIAFPLMLIYNQSFQSGKIPAIWKTAVVTPVHKKGPTCDVNNYRPISLTCVCCKLMEIIVKNRMLGYLLSNKLISSHQHGFLSKHSTSSQLLECVNDWTLAIHNKHSVDVVYIDFSKAFDTVCHSKLLYKLQTFGVNGKLLGWISDYLSGRTQCVKVGKCFSSYVDVLSGVPQGSVLGPLLFLIYINDICDIFGDFLSVKLFADDVKVYVEIDGPGKTEELQKGLDRLHEWSIMWQLNLAVNKCFVLHIGYRNSNCSYKVGAVSLADVSETVDLGVRVDSELRFNRHIHSIVLKAQQRCALIKRCFKTKDPRVLMKAFTVYVRPIIEYCSVVWNPQYQCYVKQIESVQKRFTKYLVNMKHLSYHERLIKLQIDSLATRRLKSDLCTVYSILHGCIAVDMADFFVLSKSVTRGHSWKLCKNHCSVNCRSHFLTNRCIDVWNALEEDIVSAPSLKAFKRKIARLDFNNVLL
jgi:ribonucleases P/MRP protein subunit RPP40